MATTSKETGRIEEALGKYNLNISDEEVKAAVKQIITEKVHENDTQEVKQFLLGSVELTTLKTTDSDESVMAFTERVNAFDEQYPTLPHVATICVYPRFARTVAETLEVDGVEIACIRQFPKLSGPHRSEDGRDGAGHQRRCYRDRYGIERRGLPLWRLRDRLR